MPLATFGDGNCLYRAVSTVLSGNQNQHYLLRLLTALEIIENKDTYKSDFLQDTRIMCSDYDKLLNESVTVGEFSEMGHVYALSTAINQPIRSYYPPQPSPEFSSEPLTRRVVGRTVKDYAPQITIMWTMINPPKDLFDPNHFVPLIPRNTSAVSKQPTPIEVEESDDDSTASTDIYVHSDTSFQEVSITSDGNMTDHDCSINDIHIPGFSVKKVDVIETTIPTFALKNEQASPAKSKIEPNEMTEQSEFRGSLDSGFLDTSNAVHLLTTKQSGLGKIPQGVKENCYLVINNDKNAEKRSHSKKSSFSDDCGAWDTTKGTSPKTLYLKNSRGDLSLIFIKQGKYCTKRRIQGTTVYVPMDPQPMQTQIVVVHRYYTSLKLDSTYKKKVTWLGDGDSNLAIVEYVGKFPGLGPHGNSRQPEDEYLRTPDYVMDEMTDMLQSNKPKQVYNKLLHKYDVITRPTGLAQIHDKKKYISATNRNHTHAINNIADQIMVLDNKVTQNHHFVRSIVRTNAKTPFIILYTDDQLRDIRNFCGYGSSVLGVDKTFNLCDMHVTVTCFKQLSVVRPKPPRAPPIFIGPIFIHDNSDFESYCTFFHHLKMKLVDAPLERFVIGSDDERALVRAIVTAFPESTHVLCTRHLRQNTKQKLTDDAVTMKQRHDLLEKIYGDGGILDAHDPVCFDEKCDALERQCSDISPTFLRYFQTRLRPILKTKVSEPAQLDMIETHWTNNNSESINHILKQTIDWKSRPLTDLVDKLQELVDGQYTDLSGALIGQGEYRLADTHMQFKVTKTDWLKMTDQQRDKLISRFRSYTIKVPGFVTSTDGHSTVVAPRTHGRKPGQRMRKVNVRTTTVKRRKIDD
ncbi:MAG: hypothetical protein ABW185_19850 [Sedimenticola sp.]